MGDALPDATTMQQIAAEIRFSETAFLAPATGFERTIRYSSPEAEVSFCGHATIGCSLEAPGERLRRFLDAPVASGMPTPRP